MASQAEVAVFPASSPRVRVVGVDRPWAWLARGWDDMRRGARVSFAWAFVFVAIGASLMGLLVAFGRYELIPALIAGFPLVAPILVVGLYEVSRRIERGEPIDFKTPLAALKRNASQLGLLGFVLGFIFLAWMRIATLLFAWTFGTETINLGDFAQSLFASGSSVAFLVIGTAIGAVLATVVFAICAVSVPMLLDRETDVFTAMATSCVAVRANPRPMLLWAFLIALFIGAGFALALVGLMLTLPLVAHATWHAYRDIVLPQADV